MDQALSVEEFRALERPAQVAELEAAQALGIGIFPHYVAHYYLYADYYVGLCSTKCGVDFTNVFRDGHDHANMMESIALKGLPRTVKRMTRAEWQEAMLDEPPAPHYRPKPLEELIRDMFIQGVPERYAAAKEQGRHMEYFRSLPPHLQALMSMEFPDAGSGNFEHCRAHYSVKDDFFFGLCCTPDGTDFKLVFRDGRAHADMLRAGAGESDGIPPFEFRVG